MEKQNTKKALKASEILFGRSTAEDLVSLDEELFLQILMEFHKLEVAKSDVLGSNIIDLLSEKSGFLKSLKVKQNANYKEMLFL